MFERLGDDDRDGLVVVLDVASAEQVRGVELPLFQVADIKRGDDAKHARRLFGRGTVDGGYLPFGDGGSDWITVGVTDVGIMPLIGIHGTAGDFQLTVDAVDWLADNLELVNRVSRGWFIELHWLIPSLPSKPRQVCARRDRP
ncbi:hypothetical protein D3C71_1727390 [compost metagenome]